MKIAILNDTHLGVKNGSDIFLDYSAKFYNEIFFPYLEENNIKTILHLGDYFEHRKFVNFKALNHNKEIFLDVIREKGIHMSIIPGNHDVYYKNTNKLNSLKELLIEYSDCVSIYEDPIDITIGNGDMTVGLVPWICQENEEECINFLKTSKSPVIMGHFELGGFNYMANANIKSHGMGKELFQRYESVYSGHYHTKSTQENITYLGTQMELTWSDAGDPKFFHVFDSKTRELTPIQNTNILFQKIVYDEEKVVSLKRKNVEGTYIKVIVTNKKDLYAFDKWMEKLYDYNPHEVRIIENFDEYDGNNVADDNVAVEDTPTLLNSYIDATATQLNVDTLKKMMQELLVEAQSLDTI
jgi:DNA repair exonuclease SbcCD nuclease subunit